MCQAVKCEGKKRELKKCGICWALLVVAPVKKKRNTTKGSEQTFREFEEMTSSRDNDSAWFAGVEAPRQLNSSSSQYLAIDTRIKRRRRRVERQDVAADVEHGLDWVIDIAGIRGHRTFFASLL